MKFLFRIIPLVFLISILGGKTIAQTNWVEALDPTVWSSDSISLGDKITLKCRVRNVTDLPVNMTFKRTGGPYWPELPREPLPAGETYEVVFAYRFMHVGAIRKRVKIYLKQENSVENQILVLELRGMVYK